jgi:hypothetical protein
MMVAAKSEDLEFSLPYLGNFSKGDAQSQTMSFSVRPGTDIEKKVCVYLAAFLTPSERRGKHEV